MDELAQRVDRVPGDAEHRLVAVDAGPVVLGVVEQILGVRLARGHPHSLSFVDRFRRHFAAPLPAAHVDRQLGAGRAHPRRHVPEADAGVEHRRERARGDLAAALDRHPLTRDRLLGHPEGDELALRAARLDLAQRPGADEVGVERADPAEAARDRVPLRPDVVAVQRVADLEPQRVARAEAARRDAAGEDRVPQRRRVLGHAGELDPLLAGVAGAVDHHLDAVDPPHLPGERLAALQAEPLERARALHGEQRVVVGDVAHVRAAQLVLDEPVEVGLAVRGVDDEQVPVRVEAVGDQVVDDAAVVVREQRVLRVAGLELRDVVREQLLEELPRLRPLDLELAHVRDVEDAGVGPDRLVLGDHALVLHRHLPAGERHEPRAGFDVLLVEGRAPECLHCRDANDARVFRRAGSAAEKIRSPGGRAGASTGSLGLGSPGPADAGPERATARFSAGLVFKPLDRPRFAAEALRRARR